MKKFEYSIDDKIDFDYIKTILTENYIEDVYIDINYDEYLSISLISYCPFKKKENTLRYNFYTTWHNRNGFDDIMIWQDFEKCHELINASMKIHSAIKNILDNGRVIPKEKVTSFVKTAFVQKTKN